MNFLVWKFSIVRDLRKNVKFGSLSTTPWRAEVYTHILNNNTYPAHMLIMLLERIVALVTWNRIKTDFKTIAAHRIFELKPVFFRFYFGFFTVMLVILNDEQIQIIYEKCCFFAHI